MSFVQKLSASVKSQTLSQKSDIVLSSNDQLYTIDDVLLQCLQFIPDQPLVGYPETLHGTNDYRYYTPRELDLFTNGAVETLTKAGIKKYDGTDNKVIAMLGSSDLDYLISIFALSRLGYAVLLLSTRLSVEAIAKLLESTASEDILVSPAMETVVRKVQDARSLNSALIPKKDAYSQYTKNSDTYLTGDAVKSKRWAFIIHSSGSTGLPKPIFQTHSACIANYAISKPYEPLITLPLYHNHGISTFFRAVFKAKKATLYNANLPLTGAYLRNAIETTKPESFHGVPYALKLLSEVDGGTEALATCNQVLFGGSSCPDELGDKLVAQGVNLVGHYGSTEIGQLMTSNRPDGDNAWNYMRPLPPVEPYIHMDPVGDGTYECVALDGLPAKVISNSDDPPNSFRTRDIFQKHPTIPNAWKHLGRIDDRITLVNGEKVLPIPIEHRIRQSEWVEEVLVFGVGKPLPGLLIVPSEKCSGLEKSDILEKVWPEIEAANEAAESFSQISSDYILLLDVGSSYPTTDKGTIIRKASYKHFHDIIEAVYENQESGGDDANERLSLSREDLEAFLLKLFKQELNFPHLEIETDFFDAGMNSLQAIQARGRIQKQTNTGTSKLGQNVVFETGNIHKLVEHLFALRTGQSYNDEDEIRTMGELIAKYSNFKKPEVTLGEVVVLTGVTGSLGTHLLSQLLEKPCVKEIVCLVRAESSEDALDRILSALISRSLPMLNITKIRAFASNLSEPDFGLGPDIINEFHETVTTVIHSAWAVNFNLGTKSFEQQHIKGTYSLINLCLASRRSSPARFFFCSSISVAAGTPLPAHIAESPVPKLEHAQNMGYARSKLIVERIVQNAAEKTGMVAKVLRIGQISGDTQAGQWNSTEAIPLMIQSAITMKALPALDESVSWLPVDIVAKTILDLTGIHEIADGNNQKFLFDPKTVYHVQNPKLFHWTNDLLPALKKAGLDFEIVSQREWVRRLREGEQNPTKNPTIKLLDFYVDKYDNDYVTRSGLSFETTKTEAASPSLRGGVDLIGSGLISKFVKQWRKEW